MQRVTLVRYATKPGRAEENAALAAAVSEELKATAPKGVAYVVLRDGDDFTHLFVNSRDASAQELVELPSFKAYSRNIADRCVEAPEVLRVEAGLLHAYGLATAR
jgi:quinol monooxygenase YgiN